MRLGPSFIRACAQAHRAYVGVHRRRALVVNTTTFHRLSSGERKMAEWGKRAAHGSARTCCAMTDTQTAEMGQKSESQRLTRARRPLPHERRRFAVQRRKPMHHLLLLHRLAVAREDLVFGISCSSLGRHRRRAGRGASHRSVGSHVWQQRVRSWGRRKQCARYARADRR
ncbi:uncharacterized protein SCHCODRAFT_02726587 [Schizophyllum commune H4-8]|uniref:uncharacterized protein n=1 Tax=Schizophyllum commune (strain H4-8 / FGSC 9210) TaxID=578458 RepID=UPI00215EE8D5|nr:uncharacterized protein SCHCODRAFT_02726587 [Schizophyllum commune H4-8]KAI5894709.1 hypothetical protein SCHCODRAFT_02726587 [Schizophyllum commune H4-8]